MGRFKIVSKGTSQTTRVEYEGKSLDGVQAVEIDPIVAGGVISAKIHVAFIDLEIEGDAEVVQSQEVEDGDIVDTE